MSVYEFIKNYGLDLAHRDIACLDSGFITEQDFVEANGFEFGDLRRVVESHEIVGLFKSIDQAKAEVHACEKAGHSEVLVNLDEGIGYINAVRVQQAISDVEACQHYE